MEKRVFGVFLLLVGSATLVTGVVGVTNVVDLDGDGVPAASEISAGTDPLEADTDGDGLHDGKEQELGTDPFKKDTDGDGLSDSEEVDEHETGPLEEDTDGDGLSDSEEVNEYGTDPLKKDTDEDGLDDNEEINEYGTGPLEEDSDGDDLEDGEEVNDHGSDPLVIDTDSDNLSDNGEVSRGTDPTDPDTDGDGLEDYEEIFDYQTDPTSTDTDSDRLSDSRELEVGTDPTDSDTDGDGIVDGQELLDHKYPGATPLQMDIYVEVDEISGNSLSRFEASRVEEEFAEAPVTNADGSTGINLHIEFSDTIDRDGEIGWSEYNEIKDDHFEHEWDSYHYLLVVDEIKSLSPKSDDTVLLGEARKGESMVRDHPRVDTGWTVMHELGHSLGLSQTDHDGIDSEKYSMSEYPSVMNYNAAIGYYGYSDGSAGENDFDDWGHIKEELYVP